MVVVEKGAFLNFEVVDVTGFSGGAQLEESVDGKGKLGVEERRPRR